MVKNILLGLLLITGIAHASLSESDKSFYTERNLLLNGGMESNTAQYSVSGGALASVSAAANIAVGTRSISWDASATGQFLTSTAVAIPNGLFTTNGQLTCRFKTTATDYTLQAYDGTNILATTTIPSGTTFQKVSLNFPFPSSGNIQFRVASASDAAIVYADDCYQGSATNLAQVSQAQLIGSAYFATTTNCIWSRTNTALGAFTADTDCPAITVETNAGPGTIQTADTDSPQITVNNLPPGNYVVTVTASVSNGTAAQNIPALAISDGTTTSGRAGGSYESLGTVALPMTIVGNFVYTTAGNRTFSVFGAQSANAIQMLNHVSNFQTTFSISRYPTAAQTVYGPDTSNQFGAIRIATGGTDTTTSATYETFSAAGFATKTKIGLATDPGTANDVAFKIPGLLPGRYVVGVNATMETFFTTTATTCFYAISDGTSSRGETRALASTTAANIMTANLEGVFEYTSAADKTFSLQAKRTAGGGDCELSGQIEMWIVPVNQSMPAPLLVGSVTSNSTGLERVERATIAQGSTCTATPCTITKQSGSWLSSVSRSATGTYALNIAAGVFSDAPSCTFNPRGGTFMVILTGTNTSTLVGFLVRNNSATDSDAGFDVTCMGQR